MLELVQAISSGDDDVSSYEGIRKISKYQTIASIMALPGKRLSGGERVSESVNQCVR